MSTLRLLPVIFCASWNFPHGVIAHLMLLPTIKQNTGRSKSRFTVVTVQDAEFILLLLFINYCIIVYMNNCKPTFATYCIVSIAATAF